MNLDVERHIREIVDEHIKACEEIATADNARACRRTTLRDNERRACIMLVLFHPDIQEYFNHPDLSIRMIEDNQPSGKTFRTSEGKQSRTLDYGYDDLLCNTCNDQLNNIVLHFLSQF